jgi:hypothetical protein
MFNAWHISKMFLYVQSTQTSRMDNLYFFKMSFFSTKCAPFLLKIGKDFSIDDYKGKKIWTIADFLYYQFQHIRFKNAKVVCYLCDTRHNIYE